VAAALFVAACLGACVGPEPAPPAVSPPESPKPAAPPREPETFEYFPYHVKAGDTLYALGKRFGVSWQEVADINGITKVNEMPVGRLLIIPRAPGVEVPPLEPPQRAPGRSWSARRRALRPRDLHRGKSSSRFWWPTAGRVVRAYGRPVRGLADPGIAIRAPGGTEVYAVADGTVIAVVGADGDGVSAWGKALAVVHSGGYVSWYGHLDTILVRKGQRVRKGHAIATVGASGAAPEPQLAFRLYRNDRPIDPMEQLP
jgi:murein DD-endopeptidase MepM/ murein hydrolase activator NlpD